MSSEPAGAARMPDVQTIAPDTTLIDVRHLNTPGIIAACLLQTGAGILIVDPGPEARIDTLRAALTEQGLGVGDLRAILLTHIHLDHAAATGALVRDNPNLEVWVHERGAPHMIDPTRLLKSAHRLYGSELERLWGQVLPIAEGNIRALTGGERLAFGDRIFEVMYTPGHASHHVSYLDTSNGIAFIGDCGGIKLGETYVIPPTPPPDINIERWIQTCDQILSWKPNRLFLTHFGPVDDPPEHMRDHLACLDQWSGMVRESLSEGDSDEDRADRFSQAVGAQLRERMTEEAARRYEFGAGIEYCWYGLARYWRKREEASPP